MTCSRLAVTAGAVLLLAACGKTDARPGAASSDASAPAPAAPAPPPAESAPATGIGGAPAVAQQRVDSANAAYQRQEAEVDGLSRQASGGTTP